jgi:hypothetical protein
MFDRPHRLGEPVDWVDPFIGTQSARWFFFTPAAAPFGLVKLAPDTTGFGGYFLVSLLKTTSFKRSNVG